MADKNVRPTELHSLDDHRHGIAAAEAEGSHPALEAKALEGVQQRDEHTSAARANRMPERDRTASDIGFRWIQTKRSHAGEALGGKGLVQLDEVDVGQLELRFVEHAL